MAATGFGAAEGITVRNSRKLRAFLPPERRRALWVKPTNSGSRLQNLGSVQKKQNRSAKAPAIGAAQMAWSSLPRMRIS